MLTGGMVVGRVTRGTTATNRLRRVDRWLADSPALARAPEPFVVDLGFGRSPVTTLELAARMVRVRPAAAVLGLEIDPDRVARARAELERVRAGLTSFDPRLPVAFAAGGFELSGAEGRRPVVIRAMNVLRQYDESEVADAWSELASRLAPGGLVVDGTCDEIGRVASWVALDEHGPRTLTVSLALGSLAAPSIVAQRLPKALIHRNVPGERVHGYLAALDDAWRRAAPLAVHSPSQRFRAAASRLAEDGWPVDARSRRVRLGELTVAWEAVAPAG